VSASVGQHRVNICCPNIKIFSTEGLQRGLLLVAEVSSDSALLSMFAATRSWDSQSCQRTLQRAVWTIRRWSRTASVESRRRRAERVRGNPPPGAGRHRNLKIVSFVAFASGWYEPLLRRLSPIRSTFRSAAIANVAGGRVGRRPPSRTYSVRFGHLALDRQAVACPNLGDQVGRRLRVVLQLLAQSGDVDMQRVFTRLAVFSPHPLQKECTSISPNRMSASLPRPGRTM
jgi:hypothetical protein